MPHPLSLVNPTARVIMDQPLARNPKLAALAMECIGAFSTVEYAKLRAFMVMLGGPRTLAADVYLSLDTQAPKNAAIAAASNSIHAAHKELLTALLMLADTCEGHRNKLAHGMWAFSQDVPDALLLQFARGEPATRINRKRLYVYREVDFVSIRTECDRIRRHLFDFRQMLETDPRHADGALYRALCTAPEVAERLGHLRAKAAKATPPKPTQSP